MDRIIIARADLETSLTVWLATAGIDRPAVIRDMWTRKDEQRDQVRRDAARRGLAAYLAEHIVMAKWEVTRPWVGADRER